MKSFTVNENVKFKDQYGNWRYGTINSFNWETDQYWISVTDANGMYLDLALVDRDDIFESSILDRSCSCGALAVGSTKHSWYCTVPSK